MNDKDMARLRAENGYDFGRWVGHAAEGLGEAFRVLQRIQYGRPWDRTARPGDGSRTQASATCEA